MQKVLNKLVEYKVVEVVNEQQTVGVRGVGAPPQLWRLTQHILGHRVIHEGKKVGIYIWFLVSENFKAETIKVV